MARRNDIESQEQQTLVRWFDLHFPKYRRNFFAIPNGGARDVRVAAKLKAEGVRAGVPDLQLAVARGGYFGLFIEMKAPARLGLDGKKTREGKPTQDQVETMNALAEEGYLCRVAIGFDEAYLLIKDYLQQKPTQLFIPETVIKLGVNCE